MSIVKQQTTYLSHWPSLTSEINSVNGCGDVPVRRYPPMLYPLLRLSLLYQLLPLSKRDAVTVVFDTTDGECLEDLLLVPNNFQLAPNSRAINIAIRTAERRAASQSSPQSPTQLPSAMPTLHPQFHSDTAVPSLALRGTEC